jgi:hypothetical protein
VAAGETILDFHWFDRTRHTYPVQDSPRPLSESTSSYLSPIGIGIRGPQNPFRRKPNDRAFFRND